MSLQVIYKNPNLKYGLISAITPLNSRFYSVQRQSNKHKLSPNVSKQIVSNRGSNRGSGTPNRVHNHRPGRPTRSSRSSGSNHKSYLPTGSSSVTTTLGSNKFSMLHEMDRKSRDSHRNLLSKVTTFNALKIESSVRESIIKSLNTPESNPTPIQTVAIKAIQSRRKNPLSLHTWLIASETGSGKTFAYLAPLLSKLQEDRQSRRYERLITGPHVGAVILVPSTELIEQVSKTLIKLRRSITFSHVACLPGEPQRKILARISRGIDILICTPEKFTKLSQNNSLQSSQHLQLCTYLVIDEADSLLNDSFRDATLASIDLLPNLLDLVFCTATIPKQFDRILREKFPDTIRLVSPKVHKLPSHIDFRVVEVFRPPYMDNKMLALKQALFAIYHDGTEDGLTKRVIVFVNRKQEIQSIVDELNTSGFLAVGLEGSINPTERSLIIQDFINPAQKIDESDGVKLKVLVATDLMARGIDTNRVRNIILYDLPYSSADLIHRAGRTGRVGARGRVLLLVNKKESEGWVKGLEKVVRKGLALA